MQVSLDRIEFYEPSAPAPSFPDPKTPNRPRLSTLTLPRNKGPSVSDERSEQRRLCDPEPAWEGVIVISDNDGSDDESDSNGDSRSSPVPGPERRASTADERGILGPRTVSKSVVDPISDPVSDQHPVEAYLQPPEKPRADAPSVGVRDFPLKQCTLHAPSPSSQQALLPALDASASEDDHNMERTQTPSSPISGPAYDTLHPSSRHADSLQHSSGNMSCSSSLEPDVEGQERRLMPSPLDTEVLDQIIDGTADEGDVRPTTRVDTTEGLPALGSPPSASSHLSQLSPSTRVGSQLVQPDSQDTRRAREDASSLDTTGNPFYASKDYVASTRPSPCGTAFVFAPATISRLQARTDDPLSPLRLKRTRRALPTHSIPQRYSARLRATSRNALGAHIQHEANHDSESNDGSSSEDGSDSDESYTARSINSTGERSDDRLDEDDMPAPKRRKSSPRVAATQRRSLRQSSRLSAARANSRCAEDARTPGIATPPSSSRQSSDRDSVAEGSIARFEEWPLQDVALKRVTVNGVTTFQLQFSWDRHADQRRDHRSAETRDVLCSTRKRHGKKHASSSGRPFTEDEARCLTRLKEAGRLSWTKIHELFTKSHPGRTKGSLQVYYCTKLKGKAIAR